MNTPRLTRDAQLQHGSFGASTTVPRATDNAQWVWLGAVVSCVIGAQPLAAALDSATQLVTVIIVLLLVRAHLQSQPRLLSRELVKDNADV
ncbi:hypothetical protein [Streptomyces sp. NPDC006193]|uniref:hypothetical protein n=1 Tax=Streptomyces sp. NPDC006193 TaxID=3155717 RepID=UPI0033A05D47